MTQLGDGILSTVAAARTSFWVARLSISSRTRSKITEDHGMNEKELRDAVVCVTGLLGAWGDDDQGRLRLIAAATVGGRQALVVLYPRWDTTDPDDPRLDEWNLGSAYYW